MSPTAPCCSPLKISFKENKDFHQINYEGVKFDIVGLGVIPRTYHLKLNSKSHELHLTAFYFFGFIRRRVDLSNAKVNSNDHKAWQTVISCRTLTPKDASKAFKRDNAVDLLSNFELDSQRKSLISDWVVVVKCDSKSAEGTQNRKVLPPNGIHDISVTPFKLKSLSHMIETSPEVFTHSIVDAFSNDSTAAIKSRKECEHFIWHYLTHPDGQYQHRLFQVSQILCLLSNKPEFENNTQAYKLVAHLSPAILKDLVLNWKMFKTSSSEVSSQSDERSENELPESTTPDYVQSSESKTEYLSESYNEPLEVIESMTSLTFMNAVLVGLLKNHPVKFGEFINLISEDKDTEALLEIICPKTPTSAQANKTHFECAWDLILHTDNYQMNQCRKYFQSFCPEDKLSEYLVNNYESMMNGLINEELKVRLNNTFCQLLMYSKESHQRKLVELLSRSEYPHGQALIAQYEYDYGSLPFEKDAFVLINTKSLASEAEPSELYDVVDESEEIATEPNYLVETFSDYDANESDSEDDIETVLLGVAIVVQTEATEEQDPKHQPSALDESEEKSEFVSTSQSVKSSPMITEKHQRTLNF
ncbi:hypothetical protein JQC92_12550 [Shewanella sp. 202IG2-18]|uniref:hypothetical protein n=1 Tax=Parashewanella hymeniacidonis TaxID=2807618 RepID=UPI001961FBF0|nr:hypothetical protein [Parashewanella hymeniacidonis]MBM7072851.1 hypothetical protein [Parashewanella hymeniacidonis]